jgi:hypothetical protein
MAGNLPTEFWGFFNNLCQKLTSLDRFVSREQYLGWHGETASPSGFEVGHLIELGRLLYRDVGRLRPASGIAGVTYPQLLHSIASSGVNSLGLLVSGC